MKEDELYDSFLKEIAQKIPQKVEIVNTLAETLCLAREAVYRRLRKEVPFTFNEVMTISRKLGISLDNLEKDPSQKTQPFRMKLIEYIDPADSDFAIMEEITEIMRSVSKDSDVQVGEITNILPQPLYINYKSVFRFYLFKWKYHSNRSEQVVPYKDIVIVDRLQKIQWEHVAWSKHLNVDFVFDRMLFQYLITNIEYFYYVGLISGAEVRSIMDDLFRILDYIDDLSRAGAYRETGKKVNIYISSVNVDTNYTYVSAPDLRLTIIKAFLLDGIASTEQTTFEAVQCWMRSLQKQSVMITGSGEQERISFLSEQHKIVESLSGL